VTTVTVVVPTRDRDLLLTATLRSILAQRDVDLDVVVVGDAPGVAVAVVERLADPRVRLVTHERSMGVSAARNAGLGLARGGWVAFCDDDDLWAPEKLSRQLDAVTRAGQRWVYAGTVLIDERGEVLQGGPPPSPWAIKEAMGRYNPVPAGASNVMARTELVQRLGGFDRNLRRTEDWDLWIRLTRDGLPAVVREPLVAYRMHAGTAHTDTADMVREPLLLAKRYGIPVDVAAMHRRAAWTCLRAGQRRHALRHYAAAVVRGDILSVARAGVALTGLRLDDRRLHGLVGARTDPQWVADARGWLALTSPAGRAP
jgi:glycosyltransferase involved in cell wall biosynthesis